MFCQVRALRFNEFAKPFGAFPAHTGIFGAFSNASGELLAEQIFRIGVNWGNRLRLKGFLIWQSERTFSGQPPLQSQSGPCTASI